MTETPKPGVEAAHALRGPADAEQLYDSWAERYDTDFAAGSDYRLPELVADAFRDAGGVGPVVDLGAGTGLCGAALTALGIGPVDGADISPAMLVRARGKGVYRSLVRADLTARLPGADAAYAGVVSSGTFARGHLGADALEEVVRIMAPGAVAALSIDPAHFDDAGFQARLTGLGDRIAQVQTARRQIYGPAATGAHREDAALILTFTRT